VLFPDVFDERFSFLGRAASDDDRGEFFERIAWHGNTGNDDFSRFGNAPDQTTQNNRSIMNRQNNQELIVSGIHLELTPSLKYFVREKADRLFRHEERIVRLRVELLYDAKTDVSARFKAKGHIAIHGPDMNAIVAADECHKAISLLVDKLDRMLRRRSRYFKVRRKDTHPVEFDAALPKAISA
jgi:putative sigma-54 modulation protein